MQFEPQWIGWVKYCIMIGGKSSPHTRGVIHSPMDDVTLSPRFKKLWITDEPINTERLKAFNNHLGCGVFLGVGMWQINTYNKVGNKYSCLAELAKRTDITGSWIILRDLSLYIASPSTFSVICSRTKYIALLNKNNLYVYLKETLICCKWTYQSMSATRPGSHKATPLDGTHPDDGREKKTAECWDITEKVTERPNEQWLTITYATLSKKAAMVRLRIIFCTKTK